MKKIIFLEGLPGVGKTTIINYLKDKYKINIVEEIINNNSNDNRTKYFLENDEMKYRLYDNGLIVIDRGFFSTISYEQAKSVINLNYDCSEAVRWFENYKNIYNDSNVLVLYLKRKNENYYLPYKDEYDPYGSVNNQKLLESITLFNIRKYSNSYKIIEYSYENIMEVINEIIN